MGVGGIGVKVGVGVTGVFVVVAVHDAVAG